jgi:hypothetical protein
VDILSDSDDFLFEGIEKMEKDEGTVRHSLVMNL